MTLRTFYDIHVTRLPILQHPCPETPIQGIARFSIKCHKVDIKSFYACPFQLARNAMTTFTFLSATRRIVLAAAFAATMAGCATTSTPVNLAETIAQTPTLSTLSSLIAKAGLTETLKTGGPFTIFAPTDDAFTAVPVSTLDDLAKHPEKLKDVLTYHVISGKTMAADVKNSNAKTVNGASVALSKAGDFVTIESAAVVQADIGATNGVVHTIDTVLLPPKK
jgi:uncharacterized surface protein with fasciclin (FAS1) repeats